MESPHLNAQPAASQPLVLASTSIYRSKLLQTLGMPFQTFSPNVDETPRPEEGAKQVALRLSQAKARAAITMYPDAFIIGSDQVAVLGTQLIGKPLTHENAMKQLRSMSGQTVCFYTALTLLNARSGVMLTEVAENQVQFRELSESDIESYLRKEQPYHCAGSAKFESLGIVLINKMQGDDPNALVGLPLILLVSMLKKMNFQIL